jgi:ATP-dependent helicase HrpA
MQFLDTGRRALPGLVYQLSETVRQIVALKESISASAKKYPGLEGDLERLFPRNFLEHTPFECLQQLPRYFKAIQIRAERAGLKPAKDAEKAEQLALFKDWRSRVPLGEQERFRWLLEEFRVSLFAQELGTSEKVSAAKLKSLGNW